MDCNIQSDELSSSRNSCIRNQVPVGVPKKPIVPVGVKLLNDDTAADRAL